MLVFKHAAKHSTLMAAQYDSRQYCWLLSMAAQPAVLPKSQQITTEQSLNHLYSPILKADAHLVVHHPLGVGASA
jgi:hypothetical protein